MKTNSGLHTLGHNNLTYAQFDETNVVGDQSAVVILVNDEFRSLDYLRVLVGLSVAQRNEHS